MPNLRERDPDSIPTSPGPGIPSGGVSSDPRAPFGLAAAPIPATPPVTPMPYPVPPFYQRVPAWGRPAIVFTERRNLRSRERTVHRINPPMDAGYPTVPPVGGPLYAPGSNVAGASPVVYYPTGTVKTLSAGAPGLPESSGPAPGTDSPSGLSRALPWILGAALLYLFLGRS